MPRKTQPTASSGLQSWRSLSLAPATLLYGPNEYFASRARQQLKNLFRAERGEVELEQLSAKDYKKGQLAVLTSPSLFGSAKVIEFSLAASMSEDFLTDMLAYLKEPDDSSLVVIHHSGGNRGKKLIDHFRASRGLNFIECKELKRDQDKLDFVLYEFRERGKKIDKRAAELLVAAAGSETSELASACAQLAQDGPELITEEIVDKYFGGRTEVTAFRVSDEAVKGNAGQAMAMLRHALDTGVEPIPLVGALAARIRIIARVHGSRQPAAALASEFKLAPWQVEQAQRDGRRFSDADLAKILRVLADADAQLKGESIDPLFSVEKAVLTIATAGRSR